MVDESLPHRRYNPLTDEWVLVSPHRAKRPWNGTLEHTAQHTIPEHDPACYLCPGNTRANGQQNPIYTKTFVFPNDHPAMLPDTPQQKSHESELIQTEQVSGVCRVLCYSPSHKATMAQLSPAHIRNIVDTWTDEYKTIGENQTISYVQIFENKGPLMGASSPHPHGQLWATSFLPSIIQKELHNQQTYFTSHKTPLLLAYLAEEKAAQSPRILFENEAFTILVPYWSVWPYETMVIPNQNARSLLDLGTREKSQLADALHTITSAYDKLFDTSFPYSMGLHQAPTDGDAHREWQFHIHFYPPLLRSATIKKYYVGFELMAEAQRDITPEAAAATLKTFL